MCLLSFIAVKVQRGLCVGDEHTEKSSETDLCASSAPVGISALHKPLLPDLPSRPLLRPSLPTYRSQACSGP